MYWTTFSLFCGSRIWTMVPMLTYKALLAAEPFLQILNSVSENKNLPTNGKLIYVWLIAICYIHTSQCNEEDTDWRVFSPILTQAIALKSRKNPPQSGKWAPPTRLSMTGLIFFSTLQSWTTFLSQVLLLVLRPSWLFLSPTSQNHKITASYTVQQLLYKPFGREQWSTHHFFSFSSL